MLLLLDLHFPFTNQKRNCNPIMSSVRKMIRNPLKILKHLLRDFQIVFNHFASTKHCRDKGNAGIFPF